MGQVQVVSYFSIVSSIIYLPKVLTHALKNYLLLLNFFYSSIQR